MLAAPPAPALWRSLRGGRRRRSVGSPRAALSAPRDPLRARGAGYDAMCAEMPRELVCKSVAAAAGRELTWTSARLDALCDALACPPAELLRLGRSDILAALCCAAPDDVARALVKLRLAFPAAVHAGRLAAAAPELLLTPGAAKSAGNAYNALAAALAPLPRACAALPEAVLEEPRALLSPRAAPLAARLLAAGADDPEALRAFLNDG